MASGRVTPSALAQISTVSDRGTGIVKCCATVSVRGLPLFLEFSVDFIIDVLMDFLVDKIHEASKGN
ncbi:hypothetical protein JCM15831A_00530 [Asaia astilbis]